MYSECECEYVMPSLKAPMTIRLAEDVEPLIANAMEVTGWNKNHLINESLRKALPVIVAEKIAQISAMASLVRPPTAEAGAAAARVAKRAKRA